MEQTDILKAIEERLAKVGRELEAARRTVSALEAESAKLHTAAEVISGLSKDHAGDRPLTIRDYIMECFDSDESLSLKDVIARLSLEGEFKYASVAAELSRLAKAGDLGRNDDGQYYVPQQE